MDDGEGALQVMEGRFQMTNWLDPADVERWLAEKRDGSWHGHPWKVQALEQFVRALGSEIGNYNENTYLPVKRLTEIGNVVRLLVQAMDGGKE